MNRGNSSFKKFKNVQIIGDDNKIEEVKTLTDREAFDNILKNAEEFLLKPSVMDYVIYLESLIQLIVLVASIISAWIITRMGLSIAFVLVSICFFSLIYAFVGRILTKKYEIKMRAEAQKPVLNTNQESIEWLNFLLQKIWGTIEPVATEMVPEIVDGILKENCPSFLHSIRLTKFNLGSEAPRLESVETFDENLEPEEMQMIWHASFVPVTVEERRNDENKRTSEIQATAFVGNDKFQIPLNINVSNLLFEGKILLRVRFTHSYPFIKTASVCFMEPPMLSCSLKPFVGIDVMSIPGVQEITDLTVKTVLKEFAMNPTTFDLDIENLLKVTSHDDPAGILKINLMEGRGLKNIGKLGNTSDPYLKLNLGGNEIARTKDIENDLNPFWNESKNIIIPINVIRDSFIGSDNISFEVFDKNKTSDKLMGRSEIFKLSEFAKLMEELEEEALNESNEEATKDNGETKKEENKEEESKPIPISKSKKKLTPEDRERIMKQWGDPRTGEVLNIPLKFKGESAGSVNVQISYHPVQKPGEIPELKPEPNPEEKAEDTVEDLENREAENTEQYNENENMEELRSGILRVHLYSMKDLEKRKGSRSNPYAIVEVNHDEIIRTEPKKKTNNPVFSKTHDIYVKNINTASLKLTVKDKNNLGYDQIIGTLKFKIKPTMKYLLENPTNDWLELKDSPKGRVRFGFDWFPVKLIEENENSPAIGIIRIDIKDASNLKKVDTLGLSDPYTKITISGRSVGQTRIIDNNLDPIWNETYYSIVQSRNDHIKFEIYDFNNINSDKRLGSVDFFIKDICKNVSEDVSPSKEFSNMKYKPKIQKLEDGRYDVKAPLYEKQYRNFGTQGNVHFQLQYYPLTYPGSKEAETTESNSGKSEEKISGTEVTKPKPKISGTSLSGRGFSIFTASQMGISSIDLMNVNKNNVTGILRIKLEEAKNLRQNSCVYTEFAFDNSPDEIFHRSAVIKSSAPVWDEITEGLILNIIHNNLLVDVRVRSKESGPSNNDSSILSLKFSLNDIASNLNKSVWFTDDKNNPEAPAIRLAFGYVPVDIAVPPRDYLPNMGVLTIHVDDGKVIGVDSSGTSDSYVVFNLNGNKVYETKEQKKTLEPRWDERFDINIRSRRNAELELELKDWNKIEKDTTIGTGILSLIGLVPNQNLVVPVDIISKDNKYVGIVNIILNFKPEIVHFSKQDRERSSESGAPVKVINNVAKGGFTVAKGVVMAPSSVVSGIASGISKTFKGNKSKGAELKDEGKASVTSNKQQQHIISDPDISKILMQEEATGIDKSTSNDNISTTSGEYPKNGSTDELFGTLHIHVLKAENIAGIDSSGTSDPYVKITTKGRREIGKTKVVKKNNNPEWNETFKVNLGEVLNHDINVIVKDHNSFMSSSKVIGEVQINDHNSFSTGESSTIEKQYNISSGGTIYIKLEYNADENVKKSSKK